MAWVYGSMEMTKRRRKRALLCFFEATLKKRRGSQTHSCILCSATMGGGVGVVDDGSAAHEGHVPDDGRKQPMVFRPTHNR